MRLVGNHVQRFGRGQFADDGLVQAQLQHVADLRAFRDRPHLAREWRTVRHSLHPAVLWILGKHWIGQNILAYWRCACLQVFHLSAARLEPVEKGQRCRLTRLGDVLGNATEPVPEHRRWFAIGRTGSHSRIELADHRRLVGVVHLRPGSDHQHGVRGLAGCQVLNDLRLGQPAGLWMPGLLGHSDIEIECCLRFRAVDGDGEVALSLVAEQAAIETVQVRPPVIGNVVGRAACTALHDAVDLGRVMQFLGVGQQFVPGFRHLELVLLVQVGAVHQQGNIAIDRHRHQFAGRVVYLGGLVPEHRVVVTYHLRIELETRLDVVQRREKAAMVELLIVQAVHD